MKKSETFALVAGMLGFIVDIIAVASFLAQATPTSGSSNAGSFPRVWAIILLIYGWFVVSWVLAQWRTARARKERQSRYSRYSAPSSESPLEPHHIAVFAVLVVGLLLLPIASMIGYDIMKEARSTFGFESFMLLIFSCLLSMGVIGVAIFAGVMSALVLVDDEEALG